MKRATLYTAMIVIALTAELWLLHLGRDLAAPQAIAGDWSLHADGTSRCAALRGVTPPAMSIAQSGFDIEIDIGTVRLSGLMENGALHSDAAAPCALQARLETTRPPTLRGNIQGLTFTAIRKEKP